MSETTPIRGRNAIDEIAIIILFDKELDNKTLAKLKALEEELRSDLPQFEVLNAVQMVVDPQSMRMAVPKPAGVLCAKRSEHNPDRQEWCVRAEFSNIIVTCSEYTSWKEIKGKMLDFLAAALDKLALEENPVVEIVFQCVDKFIYKGAPDQYRVGEVFNVESTNFLTPYVMHNNPHVWHIHQGWFSFHEDMQALNNLNINSHKQQNDRALYETVINHLVKIRKSDGAAICGGESLSGTDRQGGYLEKAMEAAHDQNRQVLLNLLHENMSAAIGLKG